MSLFLNFILVAIGSAIGGMARYGTGLITNNFWREMFPLSTFIVNIVGSFAIGALAGWLSQDHAADTQQTLKLLLIVGVCGGFTTFSSFSLEILNLIRGGQFIIALCYTGLSVVLCLGATAIGYALLKSSG